MYLLPRWALPPTRPSVHDMESATAVEMVAKVYGAMVDLIKEYNSFADQVNKEVSKFTGSSSAEIENFKKAIERRISCKFNDLDARMGEIKTELLQYVQKLNLNIQYDSETESITIGNGGE